MDVIDRVFGSCFRSWSVKENVGDNKYIDYLPKRKWKYSDHNLMKDLSENNPSDISDLADDPRGQTSSNMQLRLHENVFLNPVSENSSQDAANESTESEEIIMENTTQITEPNNNTIDTYNEEKSIPPSETPPIETSEVKVKEEQSLSVNNESSSEEEEDSENLTQEALLPESDQNLQELPESDQAVRKDEEEKIQVSDDNETSSDDEVARKLSQEALIPNSEDKNCQSTVVIDKTEDDLSVETASSNEEFIETVDNIEIKESNAHITDDSGEENNSLITDDSGAALISNEEVNEPQTDTTSESVEVPEEKMTNGYHHSEDESDSTKMESLESDFDSSKLKELPAKLKEESENNSEESTKVDE